MVKIAGLNYQISANNSSFSKAMLGTRSDLRLTKRLMEDSKPAAQKQAEGLARLERLYKSGAIDLRAYRHALDRLNKEQRESARSQGGLKQMMSGMLKSFTSLNPAMIAAAIAAAGFYAALRAGRVIMREVVEQMKQIDSTGKVSEKLGIEIGQLQRLRFAAEQTGVAANTLDMSLQRMVRRVAEAAQGTGEAQGALKELGVDAERLNQLSPDQQFLRIAEAIKQVQNPADQLRLAFKLFDSEGAELVRTLALGESGIKELGDQIRTVSEADYHKIAAATDSINRLKHGVTALTQSLAVELAPGIESVSLELEALINNDFVHMYIDNLTESTTAFIRVLDLSINHPYWDLGKYMLQGTGMKEHVDRAKELDAQLNEHRDRIARRLPPPPTPLDTEHFAQRAAAQQQRLTAATQGSIGALTEQIIMFGRSADEIQYIRLAQAGANAEALHSLRILQRRRAALTHQQELRKSLQETTAALREQIATWGWTADEMQRYQLERQGADRTELRQVHDLQNQRRARELRDKLREQLTGGSNATGSTASLAQGLVRGSAADYDRDRKLALGSSSPQQTTNKHLEAALAKLNQLIQATQNGSTPRQEAQMGILLGLIERLLDKELDVEEVRL